MNLKKEIQDKGLKINWVARQISVNPNTLRVYLNDEKRMTELVQDKIREFLKI